MTAAATGQLKLLAARGDQRAHYVRHDATWHRPSSCTGGMGGDPTAGYDALCGVRGLPMWQTSTEREMCGECGRWA